MKRNRLLASMILSLALTSASAQGWMNCEDFTGTNWPTQTFMTAGDTIGYAQGNSIVLGQATGCWLNLADPGIYMVGPVEFNFDGSDQTIRFETYGFLGQFNQMGFAVNGSAVSYMNGTFPMTINNVTIDLDTSVPNVGSWEYAYLTFSGNISQILIEGFESGITELCTVANTSKSGCDDFTSTEWPSQMNYVAGETVGYTQDGNQAIVLGTGSNCTLNGMNPGIVLDGTADFDFDGTTQKAEYIVYEGYNDLGEIGVSVNGSSIHFLSESFPQTIDNVLVELDESATDETGHLYAYLTLTGDLSNVEITGNDSGITDLCVDKTASVPEAELNVVTVAPNPANDWVNVSSNNPMTGLQLYALSGELVQELNAGFSKEQQLNVSNVNAGVYLLDVQFENAQRQRMKLVVK